MPSLISFIYAFAVRTSVSRDESSTVYIVPWEEVDRRKIEGLPRGVPAAGTARFNESSIYFFSCSSF